MHPGTATRQEFGTHGTAAFDGGRYSVMGRCHHGPITVGTVFALLHIRTSDAADVPPTTIHLRVDSITAYRQGLNSLDAGMTAALVLSGSGPRTIPDGAVLCSQHGSAS